MGMPPQIICGTSFGLKAEETPKRCFLGNIILHLLDHFLRLGGRKVQLTGERILY